MKTRHPETDCERREDQVGFMAWLNRNMTVPAIIAVIGMLAGAFVWLSGFTGKVQAGADAAAAVKVIEKDYVPKRDLEMLHGRISNIDRKMDQLTIEILKRLPD